MTKNRSQTITKAGYLFILINFVLAIFNIIVGLLSNSIAIISDAIHSLIDSVSGFVIVICEGISNSKKYNNYRQRIERSTTILIAIIIIVAGVHIIIESIEKILEPETIDYSTPTIIVLIASIILKYLLAHFLKNTGKTVKSEVLIASGAETLNDTWISVAVLLSVIIYLIWGVNIEAYLSLAIAIFIIGIGLEFIFPHISSHHHHPLEQDHEHGLNHRTTK